MTDERTAIQDLYPGDVAHCYGCGRLNEHGHRIRSFWDGGETVARFTPEPFHTAVPGTVYGGMIASLIDCHGTGSAALAAARAEGIDLGPDTARGKIPRFVTASLQVEFESPTPLGPELEVRGRIVDRSDRKVIVRETVYAEGEPTATGRVVAVRMPEEESGN